METKFGAFDAKNRFSELLDMVGQGQEILITRHGQEVARLVPAQGVSREAARRALGAWRESRRGVLLNPGATRHTLRDLIDEGRR